MKRIRFAIEQLREWLGLWLLDYALRVLPTYNTTREGVQRGMREQHDYDRYDAYCTMLGESPLPFHRWRQEWHWLGMKFANREAAPSLGTAQLVGNRRGA